MCQDISSPLLEAKIDPQRRLAQSRNLVPALTAMRKMPKKEEIARNTTYWCRFFIEYILGIFLHETPDFTINCYVKH
jgi:hypothetical protein